VVGVFHRDQIGRIPRGGGKPKAQWKDISKREREGSFAGGEASEKGPRGGGTGAILIEVILGTNSATTTEKCAQGSIRGKKISKGRARRDQIGSRNAVRYEGRGFEVKI